MANRAYASIWIRSLPEDQLIGRWGEFLSTVPFSARRPGFSELVIRAVDSTETPVLEQDLRSGAYGPEALIDMAHEHAHSDSCYETKAWWDLWDYDAENNRLELTPHPLAIHCYGDEFDDGIAREHGNFLVEMGFEHLFTGHAGLLQSEGKSRELAEHPAEASFVALMSQPENLRVYREKTNENIRKLYEWMARAQGALPLERYKLWSEGEENFEVRMEEVLAGRPAA